MTNMILGIIVIVIICISVFNIEEINPPKVSKEKSNLFKDMAGIFKNKYYVMIILFVIFYFLGYLALAASIQYYFTYIIGSTSAMQISLSLMTIIPMPVMLFAAYLNGKGIAKSRLTIFGGIINIFGILLLFFADSVIVAEIGIIIYAVGNGFRNTMMFAMFPDVFDYTEYQMGKTLAGTQTAVIGFGSKLASAGASAIVSALLTWGAYNSEVLDAIIHAGGSVSDIATSYPRTVLAIRLAFAGLSLITVIASILIMIPYDLDKKYQEIRKELDARKM